jgi:hypothetical protein
MMTPAGRIEFGDFQTPLPLAREIVAVLRAAGQSPDVIVEPTCGQGNFILAAIEGFPRVSAIHGFDINPMHVQGLAQRLGRQDGRRCRIELMNFFQMDWGRFLGGLEGKPLILGNPPWVTNSILGSRGGVNTPEKSNFQKLAGLSAKTGKANFDISEWMLIRLVEALKNKPACVAMLCKISVARKVLRHAWLNKWSVAGCSLHRIDAQKHFGAAVEACLFIAHTGVPGCAPTAGIYPGLDFTARTSTLGFVGRSLVADREEYLKLRDIDEPTHCSWRSGVKHDAAAVMEFARSRGKYRNGLGEEWELEPDFLFPLLKSSDVANGRLTPVRFALITQRTPSEATLSIRMRAPKTWRYLEDHAEALDSRRSLVYEKRARFAVFGVGDYTFTPWKVAVSGLYKNLCFQAVGPWEGSPVIFDDTCYFSPCESMEAAHFVSELLNSDVAQRFLRSLVFLDAKRPLSVDVLNRLSLQRLAEHLGRGEEAHIFFRPGSEVEDRQSLLIFSQ